MFSRVFIVAIPTVLNLLTASDHCISYNKWQICIAKYTEHLTLIVFFWDVYLTLFMKIKKKIREAKLAIEECKLALEKANLDLKSLQKSCPHKHVKKWTNNDGDGQYVVVRCLDCGLQKG